jgi:DNA gyrase inhibitor GyrI
MAMNLTRSSGVKVKSKPLGIERYLNSPDEVEQANLKTEVILFER